MLDDLIARVEAGEISAEDAAQEAPLHRGDSIGVGIYLSGNVDAVVDFLESNGASNISARDDYIEAYVPVLLLAETSEQQGVMRVRPIQPPGETQSGSKIPGNGPAVHGSTAWSQAGYTGSGIKLGVIDLGFTGFVDLMGTEVPATVQARCYRGLGEHSQNLEDCAGRPHGTGVVEAVMDIAPDVSLYIADPLTPSDLSDTVDWMISEGVTVINHSVTWLFDGPGDGTSPSSVSPLNTVDRAVADGIVWVNAAGNSAELSWFQSGPFSYSTINVGDEDVRVINFEGTNFENRFHLWGPLQLRWDDTWGGADSNLDLYLTRPDSQEITLTSRSPQSGMHWHEPFEAVQAYQKYDVMIAYRGGGEPGWIQLLSWNGNSLTFNTPETGSITNPAESANPGMLTVGAAHWNRVSSIQSYSSRGPTPDGRTKPDIVAADCGESVTYPELSWRRGCWFSGTSQASPHVAGLAALVRQRFPEYTPVQVVSYLKDNAQQQTSPGPNSTWGHGFVVLPPDPPQLFGSPSIDSVTAGVNSLAVLWRAPAGDGGSPITAYDLRHIESAADETVDSNWTVVENVWTSGADALSYDLTGLQAGTRYDVQVRAVNSIGDSPWSSTATGTPTIAETPCSTGGAVPNPHDNLGLVADCDTLLSVRDILAGSVTLNWAASTPITDWDGIEVGGTPRRVTLLYFDPRGLSGTIPAELGSLTGLTQLVIVDGHLTGPIPPELASLTNLTGLHLFSNQLTGPIPEELGRLTNLQDLSLYDNQLTGTIPPELGNLTRLEALHLDSNQLTGPIPPELVSLTNLRWLTLHDNQLRGEIPSDLVRLTNLEQLFLSGNRFSDCVPAELRNIYETDRTHRLREIGVPYCDVLLSGLGISPANLRPEFDPYITNYTAAATASSVVVSPTSRRNASFQYLDRNDETLADADGTQAGHQVDVPLGQVSTIRVKVTTGDGTDSRVYTIEVTGLGGLAAPSISGVTSGVDSLTVSWREPTQTGGSAITAYDLRHIRSDAPSKADPAWTVVQDVWGGSGALSHELTGLEGGVQYDVQMRAANTTGDGPWSATVTGTTSGTVPGAPTGLTARAIGQTQIDLAWSAPLEDGGTAVTGYRIEVSPDGSVWADLVADTRTTTTGYSHTGLAAGSTRHYRVSAINTEGSGPPSNVATATTEAAPIVDLVVDTPTVDTSAPTAGARFTLTATVRNQGNGRSDSTTLRYYRSTDSRITTDDTQVATDSVLSLDPLRSGNQSTGLTAPSNPGTYYYGACVDAVSDESDTTNNCSAAVVVTVGAAPAPDLVVDAPTVSESAPAANARFTLSATVRNQGNSSSAFTRLRYYQSTDSTITTDDTEVGTDSVFGLDASESGDESVRLDAPSIAGTYYYGACVDSLSDESDATNNCSPAVTVTVGAVTNVPGTPSGLTATSNGQTQIGLSWSAPSEDGGTAVTGYRIEVSPDGSTWADLVVDSRTTTTSYSHTGLVAGSTRHYRVSVINSEGSGPPSNVASATTETPSAVLPNAPTGLTAAVNGQTQIDLSWSAPTGAPTTSTSRTSFEAATPSGYTAIALRDSDSVWGVPEKFTSDSSLETVAYMLLGTLKGCSFANSETDRSSKVYVKTEQTGRHSSFESESVCRKRSSSWRSYDGLRVTHLRFYDESSPANVREYTYESASGQYAKTPTGSESSGGSAINGYHIEVSEDGSNWSDLVSDTRSSRNSYSHTGLMPNSTRYYRVSAISAAGTGPASNVASTSTGAATEPDLAVDTPTVSSSALTAGASFTLNASVRNQGNGRSDSTTLRYYQSTDSTITTADTQVGTDPVSSLNALQSGDESISLTAPSTPGTYHYGACVDAVSDESDTTNNCSGGVTVNVGAAPAPDLVVDTPTVSSSVLTAGARITLSASVRNQGNGSSSFTTLRYYRSTDFTITTGDTELGTDSVVSLDASESGDGSISLTAPSTPGTYYYGACVDSVSGETDTTNNCSSSVTVTAGAAPAPDLVVDPPTVSESAPAAGANFRINTTVRNQGNGGSDSTTLRYYRSTDSTITTADTEVDTDYVSRLDASESGDESARLTAPSTPGTYYYGVCVDSVSDESDTANNCSSAVTVTVGALASVPGAPTGLMATATGQTQIDLSWTAPTDGGGSAITGYKIEVSANGSSWSDLVDNTNSTDTRYSHTGLTAGTTRHYRVSAINPTGTGPASSVAGTATDSQVAAGDCATGGAVANVASNPGLVSDCETLLAVKDTLRGTETLDWSARIPIGVWDGITTGGTPQRVTRVQINGGGGDWLTGKIPSDLGDLDRLTHLDLRANGLTGSIPPELGNLEDLVELRLWGNELTESIPGELGSLDNLEYLDLGNNQLTGSIPSDLGNLGNLGVLGLYDNQLSGIIPPELGRLSHLHALWLNENLLTGMPAELGRLTDLGELHLHDNRLTGPIPPELGNLSSLWRLTLNYNSLEGPIPEELGNLTTLKYLSINGNRLLTGCVPTVLRTQLDMTYSNLGNLLFCDESPGQEAPGGAVSGPDLVVDNSNLRANLPPGYHWSPNATVRNQGDSLSASTTLRYYRSTDPTITTSDTQVSTDRIESLAPFGRTLEAAGLNVPTTPGTYYYGACVDAVAGESDTTNNCSSATEVTVRIVNSPPQVVGDIDDLTVVLGESFRVDISVVFNEPDGEQVGNYGFTLRTKGIITGVVHTPTGILNLRAVGVGVTTVAVEASDIHGNGSGLHDLFDVTVVPSDTKSTATVPEAPTGLTATADGQTEINLSWTAPSNDGGAAITGYRIEVSTDDSSWSDLVSDTDSTSTSYSHTGLTAGDTRHYRVAAINSAGAGEPSNVADATTESRANSTPEAVGTIPEQVLTPMVEITIDVSPYFTDPERDDLTYSVDSRQLFNQLSVSGSTVTMRWDGLLCEPATVVVTARDPGGLEVTQQFTIRRPNSPPVASSGTFPAQTIDVGEASPLSMSNSFSDPDTCDSRQLTYMAVSSDDSKVTASASGNTVTVTGVSAGNTTVTVTAQDTEGLEATLEILVWVVAAVEKPSAPTGLSATADGQTEIDLSWTAPSDDGGAAITGYRIEVSTGGSSWSELVSDTGSTMTSYSHTGLSAGSTRHYKVSAINSVGTGNASNVARDTTDSAPLQSVPSTDAVTGVITECSGESKNDLANLYEITIAGTLTAIRPVGNVLVTGELEGEFLGVDSVGDMAADATTPFTISSIVSLTSTSVQCSVQVTWLEIN